MPRLVTARTLPQLKEEDIVTDLEKPSYQAYEVLHVGYSLIFMLMGADKFLSLFTDWSKYFSSGILGYLPLTTNQLITSVGLLEITMGVITALAPRIGGYLLALWMWLIIANLVLLGNYFEVGLLMFGLSLGALSLARLSKQFDKG